MTSFSRYIGIDYSGAETPTASLKGLRAYVASESEAPLEVPPPSSPRRYWTRKGLAEWLAATFRAEPPALVGIDHVFSFPCAYFQKHGLADGWQGFSDDFCAHWPTDEDHVYVEFVREGVCGNGAARQGNPRWRRLTEQQSGSAKSVFHFDVPGSVAKSSHAGIPWLRFLRRSLGPAVHFWPFDGWVPKAGVHVIAEVYPSLWRGRYPAAGRTPDQQDAYTTSRWLQETDLAGELAQCFQPSLTENERAIADLEGWILGVR